MASIDDVAAERALRLERHAERIARPMNSSPSPICSSGTAANALLAARKSASTDSFISSPLAAVVSAQRYKAPHGTPDINGRDSKKAPLVAGSSPHSVLLHAARLRTAAPRPLHMKKGKRRFVSKGDRSKRNAICLTRAFPPLLL
jgi:hypothetical protein